MVQHMVDCACMKTYISLPYSNSVNQIPGLRGQLRVVCQCDTKITGEIPLRSCPNLEVWDISAWHARGGLAPVITDKAEVDPRR